MNRKQRTSMLLVLLILFIGIGLLLIGKMLLPSPKRQAIAVVNEFYTFEQEGDFYSSWTLFHSLMQEKFTKGKYMEERAHVFLNYLNVETSSFEVSKPQKVKNWRMADNTPLFEKGYSIAVAQSYSSKYGNLTLYQEVFVIEEDGEWKILWDYN